MDWIVSHGWALWLVLILVLTGIEMLSLDLIFIMLAAGAAAGLIVALVGAPFALQIVVAALVSLVMIFTVRPVALKQLHHRTGTLLTNVDRLVGAPAMTLEEIDDVRGLIKLDGETWSARSANGSPIDAGQRVVVARIEGAIAMVTASDRHGGMEE